ncbi:hypothetical protein HETIRDRAFT_407078, partial [Heterobasidion irregulare TC 32-1]
SAYDVGHVSPDVALLQYAAVSKLPSENPAADSVSAHSRSVRIEEQASAYSRGSDR